MARKRCKRQIKPVSHILTPHVHERLMMKPRMHWSLLMMGQCRDDYVFSLVGLFAVVKVIAGWKHQEDTVAQFCKARTLVERLALSNASPTIEDAAFVTDALNAADRLLGVQTCLTVHRATLLIREEIEGTPAKAAA